MFDGESFKKIKRARIGGEKYRDKLTAVWFELMDFAGKCNHGGAFINSREIPFATIEDIATMIDREPDELDLCMAFYVNEGMVEIIDDVYRLSNWDTHQNEHGLQEIREKARLRKQRERERKRALLPNNVTNVTRDKCDGHALEIRNKNTEIRNENLDSYITADEPPTAPHSRIDYSAIQDLYNNRCPSFPKCTALSDARKKAIKARFASGRTIDDFEELFKKAEASSFLKGANGHNWRASFDWLIKDANMAKVLDGNYDDTKHQTNGREGRQPEHWDDMPWDKK